PSIFSFKVSALKELRIIQPTSLSSSSKKDKHIKNTKASLKILLFACLSIIGAERTVTFASPYND
ncbi:MAG: hypothetical protein ACU83U_11900, partial [Gammaproteobacteria bacterium]